MTITTDHVEELRGALDLLRKARWVLDMAIKDAGSDAMEMIVDAAANRQGYTLAERLGTLKLAELAEVEGEAYAAWLEKRGELEE